MKEATGELSMTVIVIIAVIAILAILTWFLLPSMKNYISNTWSDFDTSSAAAKNTTGMGKK